MKSKKIRSLFCAAALTLSLAACGSKSTTDYSGQTVTGEITDIDGTAVTMQFGELSAGGMPCRPMTCLAVPIPARRRPTSWTAKRRAVTAVRIMHRPTAVSRPQSPTARAAAPTASRPRCRAARTVLPTTRAVIPTASLQRNLMAGLERQRPRRHGRQQLYRGRGECDARLRECGNYKK